MNGKINILFFLPNFDTGGSEKLVIDIIKALDRKRFNPVLIVFFTGTYEKEFLRLGVPFYVIHRDGIRSKFSTFSFLRTIMKEHGIQVVNTHHTSPLIQGLLPCKVFGGAAMVHTEHTKLSFDRNIHTKALFLEKIFLRKVDAVVGISKGVCDYFVDDLSVPEDKVRMILNGVDVKRFDLKGFDRAGYRASIGARPDDVLIGLLANFRPQKNHASLIKAVSLLKQRGKRNVKLLLCGTGPTEAGAKELALKLGVSAEIGFMGMRTDIPELMNSIDIYCLPSHFEGLPFSALEAMAARRPVVLTDVAGNNEIVTDGCNGILVEPGSPESLADGITRFLDDPALRDKIATAGYEFVQGLSFERMMESYEDLFAEVAEAGRVRRLR